MSEMLPYLLAVVTLVVLAGFAWTRFRSSPMVADEAAQPDAGGGSEPKASSLEQAVAQARADVERVGWHLVVVFGEKSYGFVYTVGLWKTYQHPELMLTATRADPRGMVGHLQALASRIAEEGLVLEDGKILEGTFGTLPAAVRSIRPEWAPGFLGVAGGFYGSFDFPALQLFWPDDESRFPWQSDFDSKLFPVQPLLFESNLILANLGFEEAQQLADGTPWIEQALEELFVEVDGRALDDWRWLVGPEATLLRTTLFGDVLFEMPDGSIHWLDCGYAETEEIASNVEEWRKALIVAPHLFFPASLLLTLRALDWHPEEGGVYAWIVPPFRGGEQSLNNLQRIDAWVSVSNAGRTAEAMSRAN